MSLTLRPLEAARDAARPLRARRALLALLALGAAAALLALLGWVLASGAPAPPPPARNPFGIGPREAAPAATGISGLILAWQAQFYRSLTSALSLLRREGAGLWTLVAVSFAYGVFHAAGPGHGKAVISAYILSSERATALRAFGLSLSAALVQAAIAIALVLTLFAVMKATAASMNRTTALIEMASFAAIALVGLWALWRKAGVLNDALNGEANACAPGCAHGAAIMPAAPYPGGWLRDAAVAATAGLRPCAGALIVLSLALSQGILAAGVAAVIAMALGVALTTGGLALLAVAFKRVALTLAGGRGERAAITIRALECLAAALIAVFGAALLLGLWSSVGAT
jgi:ABC-type nickel/cobalt efflux system permease component RcnA